MSRRTLLCQSEVGNGTLGKLRKNDPMKLISAMATVALLWGGMATAKDFKDTIRQAYTSAGYSNIVVNQKNDRWIVTADVAGVSHSFLVNRQTGASTPFDLVAQKGADKRGHDNTASTNARDDTTEHGSPVPHDGQATSDDGAGHDVTDSPDAADEAHHSTETGINEHHEAETHGGAD